MTGELEWSRICTIHGRTFSNIADVLQKSPYTCSKPPQKTDLSPKRETILITGRTTTITVRLTHITGWGI